MMKTVAELASLVSGRVQGEPSIEVTGCAGIESAGAGELSFISDPKYLGVAARSKAAAIVAASPVPGYGGVHILVADPNLAFARIVDSLMRGRISARPGIEPGAHIAVDAKVDASATVRAGAYIASGARVGARTVVFPGTYIGERVSVGADCILYPNVVLREDVRVMDRVILHSGVVVGADGFGYATDPAGVHVKIPQVGTVIIEDDVEIGANSCIDRARFEATRIGKGTKIDNLVQIGHNVVVGDHSLIVAQAGVAGSTKLGKHVVLGGHVGVAGHLEIGDGAQVSAFSGVGNNLPGGAGYMGVPARPIAEGKRVRLLQLKLPEIWERLKTAEAALRRLGALPEEPPR